MKSLKCVSTPSSMHLRQIEILLVRNDSTELFPEHYVVEAFRQKKVNGLHGGLQLKYATLMYSEF